MMQNSPKFQEAGVAETLRSSQKDEYYLRYMRNLSSELIQKALGIPYWLKRKELFDSLSDFIYYALTTASGFQTLGEEYVYIVQVDSSLRKLPSRKRRFAFVILQALGPALFLYCQRNIEKKLKNASENERSLSGKRRASAKLLKTMSFIFWSLSFIQRLHLVLFYFNGAFYHLSKRLTGIKYVMLRRWLGALNSENPYKILGYVTACQLCISVSIDLYNYLKSKETSTAEDNLGEPSISQQATAKSQCSLCLEKSKDSTVTPCGHIFCWTCITNWLQNKEECPLCREKFTPSRLVYLQNYM